MTDGVLEMRLVVTAPDYDEALRFYRDVLGLREIGAFDDGAGRVSILDAGRATLELSDVPHAEHIDRLEVGRRVAGHVRVAFEVPDAGGGDGPAGRAAGRRSSRHRWRRRGGRSTRGSRRPPGSSSRCSRRLSPRPS